MLVAPIFLFAALLMMLGVRRGEAVLPTAAETASVQSTKPTFAG
jgi:hypothetical protein